MKTVSGKLISSKPVSLSKAAKILSGFAGHENGASDAVSVYLRRAADVFNNMVAFHKELKNPHSVRKYRTPYVKIEGNPDNGKVEILKNKGEKKIPDIEVKTEEALAVDLKAEEKYLKNKTKGEKNRKEKVKIEQISRSTGIELHADEIEEGSVKKREKKKRKNRDGEEAGESVELEERKSRDVDGGETIDLAGLSGKKKRKRRKSVGED